MAVEPIRPDQVVQKKQDSLPDEVIEAFNELIGQNWNGSFSSVTVESAIQRIITKMTVNDKPLNRSDVFRLGDLEVEDVYRAKGWKVVFDKDGWDESYESRYEFTRERI